jgi:hypothetical protein
VLAVVRVLASKSNAIDFLMAVWKESDTVLTKSGLLSVW